jgi:hypothetical protein
MTKQSFGYLMHLVGCFIRSSTHWNLIGHCVVGLSTGTTVSYIFLVTIYNLRRTHDICLKLSNFKTDPLLMSHSRYKVLNSKSQGQMHSILCRTLKYVYVRQAVVILQPWSLSPSTSGFESLLSNLKS